MVVEHGAVGIPEARAIEARTSRTLTKFLRRNSAARFFVNSSKVSVLQQPFVTDAIVNGWVSAQRYRELQVWDGTKVVRAGKERRAAALRSSPSRSRTSAVTSRRSRTGTCPPPPPWPSPPGCSTSR